MEPDYGGRLFRRNFCKTLRLPNQSLITHRACNQRDELWSDLKRKRNLLDNFYFPIDSPADSQLYGLFRVERDWNLTKSGENRRKPNKITISMRRKRN